MSISERLKLVCQEKNWKLKDFSEATGLPYRTAQGYLNGTREPNAEGMAAIASIDIDLNWLITGVKNRNIINETSDLKLIELELISKLNKCNEIEKKFIINNLDFILNNKIFK